MRLNPREETGDEESDIANVSEGFGVRSRGVETQGGMSKLRVSDQVELPNGR
jgi:hypothetical protein